MMEMTFYVSAFLFASVTITGGQITDPAYYRKTVSVPGVISAVFADEVDTNYVWMALRTPSSEIMAAARTDHCPIRALEGLIDAEVVLTGRVESFSAFRDIIGKRMLALANGTNDIRVVAAAPDPFVPNPRARWYGHQLGYDGIVTAIGENRFCVRKDDDRHLEVHPLPGQTPPAVGDRVSASGFPSTSYLSDTLIRARYRVCAHPGLPDEKPADLADAGGIDISCHGKLLRMRGTLHHLPNGEAELLLGQTLVRIEGPKVLAEIRARAPSGSTVEISGIYLLDFSTDRTNGFQAFDHYTIIPRTADDIRVIGLPARRILAVILYPIGGLVLLLVAYLIRAHILRRQAEVKIRERTRLAVELHDSVSQTLTGVALQLENAIEDAGDAPARTSLTAAERLLANCRSELQSCLWDLKSRTFDEKTLTEACQTALTPFTRGASVRVRFNAPLARLRETETSTVLKIVRELTSNAIRHGKAGNVRIAGELREGRIRFTVTDDGCGFNPKAAPGPADGHFGIAGIRERLRPSGGSVEFAANRPFGTKVTVTMNVSH